jgi:drug/metabolite transporter (DMT)-like permease
VGVLIFILLKDPKLLKAGWADLLLFIGSGIALFATASSYYSCLQITSISTAVVLMYTSPVIVMLASVLFLGERLNKFKLISIVFMVLGCALVSGVIGGMKFDAFGIMLGILSSIAYSAYNILAKIQMMRKSSPVTATFYCFVTVMIIALSVSEPAKIIDFTAKAPLIIIPIIIGLGVCTFIIPYVLYTIALKNIPAGTASALSIVEPMAATVFSIVIFKDVPTVYSAIGIALIIIAVFLLSRTEKQS